MVDIAPQTESTVHDKLTWACSSVNKAIADYQRSKIYNSPLWANLQDTKRSIDEAMQMLREGRKPV